MDNEGLAACSDFHLHARLRASPYWAIRIVVPRIELKVS
jgi:hypothetical protein